MLWRLKGERARVYTKNIKKNSLCIGMKVGGILLGNYLGGQVWGSIEQIWGIADGTG